MNERLALIALGANLGDPIETLRAAFYRLSSLSDEPIRTSSLWQSTPVDCPPGSPLFVNAAAALLPRSAETPETLLTKLQALEAEFGRKPKLILNEPRPLDLDLIAFADEVRSTPRLTLPHPRAQIRRFVLQPLAEVAPNFVLPGQRSSVADLLQHCTSSERVTQLHPPGRK